MAVLQNRCGKSRNTGFLVLKKATLLLLLISLSVSHSADGRVKLMSTKTSTEEADQIKESTVVLEHDHHEDGEAHPCRILMVRTNDYGRYNAAPTFAKPHFKQIPS